MLTDTSRWSHARGNEVVPSRWQATSAGRSAQETPCAHLESGAILGAQAWPGSPALAQGVFDAME